MSSNFALVLLHFLLFLFLNRVGTANAFDSRCEKECKNRRPAGTSGPYVLDCGTISDSGDQYFCRTSRNSFCPKKICDEKTSGEGSVKLNCPDPAELSTIEIVGIAIGCVVGVLLIGGCICAIVFLSRRRRQARGMQGASMQPPPPMMPMTGAGYAYGAGSSYPYPPSSSGASTTSTVQQEKTTGQSAVS